MFSKIEKPASHRQQLPPNNNLFIQPKLNIGKSNDKYEVEADRMADTIVSSHSRQADTFFSPAPVIQKLSGTFRNEEENEGTVQNKLTGADELAGKQEREEEEPVQEKEGESPDIQAVSETEKREIKDTPLQTKPESFKAVPIVQKNDEEEIREKEDDEEEPIQEKRFVQASGEMPVEEEHSDIQRKADGSPVNGSSIESQLNSSKGSGSPLPEDTRSEMEPGFGSDFGNVRIHTGSEAVQMSKGLGAQAFTHGSDIYFNEGKYNPSTSSGKHLLAHELTHTVQQGASLQTKMVQKVEGEEDLPVMVNSNTYRGSEGIINKTQNTIEIPEVSIPALKQSFTPSSNLTIRRGRAEGESRDTQQRTLWDAAARDGSGLNTKLDQKIANAGPFGSTSNPTYYMKIGHGSGDAQQYLIGTRTDIRNRLLRPYWRPNGVTQLFEVDHQREYQLNGEDTINNLWLLEREANGSSGRRIDRELESRVNRLLTASSGTEVWNNNQAPNFRDAKRNFDITFRNVNFNLPIESAGNPAYSYTLDQIKEEATQMDIIQPLTLAQVQSEGLAGSPTQLIIFNNATGGRRHSINVPTSEANTVPFTDNTFLPGFRPTQAIITPNQPTIVTIQGQLWSTNPALYGHGMNCAVEISAMEGIPHTGRLNVTALQRSIEQLFGSNNIQVAGLSPIQITSFEVDEQGNMIIIGKVITNIPLIDNADIDIAIRGNDIRVEKTFYSSDFNIPGPVNITNSTLTVAIGTESGFSLTGEAGIEIPELARGQVSASAQTGSPGGQEAGFNIAGYLEFDTSLFDPARIDVRYENNILTIGGTLTIPRGKVRGIETATITATYDTTGNFTATGEAELDIPGIERGTMSVNYSPEGFSISGNFNLSDDIPGIRGGSVEARVSKAEGAENYDIFVSGTAQPAIPGIDSTLTVTYDNGALTIEGSAAYSRGMLSGRVNIGATNRTIGDDGLPTGEPDNTMRVYGGGSLTLTLTPWLQATAGVNFLPNGEIEVTGRIGLPGTVDVFDRKSINRNLFNIPAIEIPIFAIPLGPRSIGLVARITGGLDFSAGFGPGQLRELSAEVTYNPDHEDQTTITGRGVFAIPADAGLTLRGDLGLGVSIGIASLSGGIEIAGTLGLEGEASAAVDVNWSPQTGLAIDAEGRITVNPKFTFDINAFARASLDLWVTSISETWRYNLASFSWGPDIQFGIVFPVHYREGEPFDMSFDDIEVIYPDLDIVDMAVGLARDIKDNIFD